MTSLAIDTRLLEDFMHGFYGYGNYQAGYWFIGMEEGGGNTFEEIARRLAIWERLGRNELEDVAEYHFQIGMPHFFRDPVKLQSTWNKLIRILLSAEGRPTDTEAVRQYQKNHLGRNGGESCLLELLPLPSPSTHNWLYDQLSGLPMLRSRQSYQNTMIPRRISQIRARIAQHRPQAVVFYGSGYLTHWQRIVPVALQEDPRWGFWTARCSGTVYAVTKHPVATGVTNEYFHTVGKRIANLL